VRLGLAPRLFAGVLVALVATSRVSAEPRHIDWFALDLDLGGGIVWPDREAVFFGRARVGYARARDDLLSSIGVAASTKELAALRIGVAAEAVWLRNGLAGNAGVMMSSEGDPAFELGAGWLGLRVEGQIELSEPAKFAVVAFARIPLGAVAYKLWGE
jgi:hypothetical protein